MNAPHILCDLNRLPPDQGIQALLDRVDHKKRSLDALRPLSPEQAADLKRLYDLDLTYNSNAIEGSTLTYAETRVILEQGITVAGKPLKEHLEVINHKEAIDFIEALADQAAGPVRQSDLLSIHNLILRGIDSPNAGRYRTIPVGVRQSDGQIRQFCDPLGVGEAMEAFFAWLADNYNHPVQKAGEAHLHLVTIHPFVDGNGRTARLLMNLMLLRAGYPPAVIQVQRRPQYIESLETVQRDGDRGPFLRVIIEAVEASLDLHLDALRRGTRFV